MLHGAEHEKKAYYESSQQRVKENKETIHCLRKENKKLRKKLADSTAGDEKVINDAFQNRSVEKAAMRTKSAETALQIVDQKVCDRMKRLNVLKYEKKGRKRRLKELQDLYDQITKETYDPQTTDETDSVDARTLRMLENRLEKAQLKTAEAEHIANIYQKLKVHLQDESLTFGSRLEALQAEVLRARKELQELQVMNDDAELLRDAAEAELQRLKNSAFGKCKKLRRIMAENTKQAEELKAQRETLERRILRRFMQPDGLITDIQCITTGAEEDEKAKRSFEEAFDRIKEAADVTDIQEIVGRFTAQGEKRKQLEDFKLENEKMLVRMNEEKERLEEEFQEMKYGSSEFSRRYSGQQMLEELQSHLKQEETRRDKAEDDLEYINKVLMSVKAGMECFANKLQHIKLPKGHIPEAQLVPSSDDYVLDLLSNVEAKLMTLMEDLDGGDMTEIFKEMGGDKFRASIGRNLPSDNVRIEFPLAQVNLYEDAEDRDEDGITRIEMKKQSQQLIDSKLGESRGRNKKGKQ